MLPPLGFIGLGLMGKPMALNLRKAGYPLIVYSRSRAPVDALVAAGATRAGAPDEVAQQADVIITMLPDTPDVEQVLRGPRGVLDSARPGAVIIDMSSISPDTTRELAADVERRGGTMLDAPVSGGEIGAIGASLSIMVGGPAETLERVRPILEAMGDPKRITHIGGAGAGQLCKVCNQIAIGGALAAVSEAFALAGRAGVDRARVRQALLGGFAASRVLEVHGQRILDDNYVPGFRTALYLKDMRIAVDTASRQSALAPVSQLVHQLLEALVTDGGADLDYSALATVFAKAGELGA